MVSKFDVVNVLLIASIACVAGMIGAYSVIDDGSAEFDIISYGEGTVDPSPGLYSIEPGSVVTLTAEAAEGYLLSMISINGEDFVQGTNGATMDVVIEGRTVIEVHFITYEIEIPDSKAFTYNGESIVAYESNAMYDVTGGSAKDAGTYETVLSLVHPEYCHWPDGSNDDITVEWTIEQAHATVSAVDKEKIYGSIEGDGFLTAEVEGLFKDDTVDFALSREVGEDVGTYVITPTGESDQGNYLVTYIDGALTITERQVVPMLDAEEFLYDGEEKQVSVGIRDGDILSSDLGDVSLVFSQDSVFSESEAGSYVIRVTGLAGDRASNYCVDEDMELYWSIEPKSITSDMVSIMSEHTYDGQSQSVVFSVKYSGMTLVEGVDYVILGGESGIDAGDYVLRLKGMGNYTSDEVSKGWSILPYVLKDADFGAISPIAYTGSALCPVPVSVNPLVTSNDYVVSYSDNRDVGVAKATIQGRNNATGIVQTSFDIYATLGVDVISVTKNGSTQMFDKDLSWFGKNGNPGLFDLDLMYPGVMQSANMSANIGGHYEGMWLGLIIGDVSEDNKLLDTILVSVDCKGSRTDGTLRDLNGRILNVLVTDGSPTVPLTVSIEFPTEGDHSGLMGLTLDFKLTLCLMPPDNSG